MPKTQIVGPGASPEIREYMKGRLSSRDYLDTVREETHRVVREITGVRDVTVRAPRKKRGMVGQVTVVSLPKKER